MIRVAKNEQGWGAVETVMAVVIVVLIGAVGYMALRNSHKYYVPPAATGPSHTNTGANNAKVLDYSNQNLASVGSNIYSRTDATQLILSYNSLRSLPSQLGNMDKLQVLKVDHNQLQGALIAEIRKMPLVTLDASYNDMTGVPAEIGQLNQLQTLDYSYNKISTLPNEISNLKQLKTLNLAGNPLSAAQISKLKAELPNTNVIF